jgi:hypothetical protein
VTPSWEKVYSVKLVVWAEIGRLALALLITDEERQIRRVLSFPDKEERK